MAADDQPGPDSPLQFDRVDTGQPAAAERRGVACRACAAAISTHYFSMGHAAVCDACATRVERSRAEAGTWRAFGRAVALGAGAMLAGAIVYYAVLAVSKLEIGLVAILIGYMVGWAVRRGSRGWGGRRYQVLALVLTYYAVGLAYLPLAIQSMQRPAAEATAGAPSSSRIDPSPAPRRPSPRGDPAAAAMLLMFCFALPVLSVIGSLPGGAISAIIIGVGMRQAWRMTAAPSITITGPYRVGAEPATA
jgi:hypothetical protein